MPNESEFGDDQANEPFERRERRRRLQAARKGLRRNLRRKPPRKKSWLLDPRVGPDDVDYHRHERIMPIDEADRRRAIARAAYQTIATQAGPAGARAPAIQDGNGIVVSVSSGLCTVVRNGAELQCHVKSTLTERESAFTNVVAVGDEVIVRDDGAGGGIIEEVLARHSMLARPDVYDSNRSRRTQVIVSNADQLLIVSSWKEPMFWPELVDRCLIAAQRSDLLPIVCINKTDLVEDPVELERALQPYLALGYRTLKCSVLSGRGVDELGDLLRNKITALTGLSGTGKSSLISVVQPGLQLRTSHVSSSRKRRGEGRHTTTQVTMLRLDSGGFVVDTPGIREFGLSGLRGQELAGYFPEVSGLATECRFNNCVHLDDAGCAVRAASAAGIISASRYHSYRTIYKTLPQ